MLGGQKFDALIITIRQSLKHCQQENFGGPFDKAAQYAFAANNYDVLTAFNVEFKADFKSWLFSATENQLNRYVKGVYYPIAFYGVLFASIEQDYECRLVCNDGKAALDITKYDELNKLEAYQLVSSYASAITHQLDWMREVVAEYFTVDLVPFRELTSASFTIDGDYVSNSLTIDEKPPVGSTKRRRLLIYFYEGGKMLERKHKDYNDYIQYATPKKRLSYPNESQSKLKHLIEDIEIIRDQLSEKAKQQADIELNTLKQRLTVEK